MRRILATLAVVGALLFSGGSAWAESRYLNDGLLAYERGDYASAFYLLLPNAADGYAPAQFKVGEMYYRGKGTAQNYTEAARWYRNAAEQGHVEAQSNLGFMYRNGMGVSQNYTEALKWFRKVAEQADVLKPGGWTSVMVQETIGNMYYIGEGVSQNYTEAMKWYLKAAEWANPMAQWNLAIMFAKGDGVPVNNVKALMWRKFSLKQGYAQFDDIGSKKLWSVEKQMNPAQISKAEALAVETLRRLAEKGRNWAAYSLGVLYDDGDEVPKSHAEAVKWFRKAAEQGHLDAQRHLAFMYSFGLGVPKNDVRAYMWYLIAKTRDRDDERATESLDSQKKFMTPAQIDEAQKLAAEWWEEHND